MPDSSAEVPFALYHAGDAYSTAQKIMGRQSAGKAFLKGLARRYPQARVSALGPAREGAAALQSQLRADGHQGSLDYSVLPDLGVAQQLGTLYFPAPPTRELAHLRQRVGPRSFSIMGVTHTLSSKNASDQIADLLLPPFEPWDALICTSQAALRFAQGLHDEVREYFIQALGASRFVQPHLQVIPLGVDAPSFARTPEQIQQARAALGLAADEVCFFFAGRLSFHAKANPLPLYAALEQVATEAPPGSAPRPRLVCLEAGVHPNPHIQSAFQAAQKALAPHVRFISVDGRNEGAYRHAWQAADVFASLSDNIQETFGLTPVEAMAAGLPVLISDWNGYQDTVRHGVDGLRVPTINPPAGAGDLLALRHVLDVDNYDMYIGRTSLATVVEPPVLADSVRQLALSPELRARMGEQGRRRAHSEFDWPVVLERYAALSQALSALRQQAAQGGQHTAWPQRADPFARFAHFASATLQGRWQVQLGPDAVRRFDILAGLSAANYGFDPVLLPKPMVQALLQALATGGPHTVDSLLQQQGGASEVRVRALMWLWKFDVIRLLP
jgi:starch synthase